MLKRHYVFALVLSFSLAGTPILAQEIGETTTKLLTALYI